MIDELTAEQTAELGVALQALKAELAQTLAAGADSAQPVDLDQPIGRVSRVDAIQQQRMAQASRSSQQQRLSLVARALIALDRGEYGLCRECEEPIGYSRLKARPETLLCRDCQAQREESSHSVAVR